MRFLVSYPNKTCRVRLLDSLYIDIEIFLCVLTSLQYTAPVILQALFERSSSSHLDWNHMS